MSEENKSNVAGILSGIAAIITAVGGIYIAVQQNNRLPVTSNLPATESPSGSSQSSASDSSAIPTVARTISPTPATTPSPTPSEISPRPNEVQAVIDDSDGYTNVRSGQSIQHSIIARVVEGEIFYTTPQKSDWWPVRTKNNKFGYMHRSRIRLQN